MGKKKQKDIPVRTLVWQQAGIWKAHCLDFDLRCEAATVEDAVSGLEDKIANHVKSAKAGKVTLFRTAGSALWERYFKTAEEMLLNEDAEQGATEHRYLMEIVPAKK